MSILDDVIDYAIDNGLPVRRETSTPAPSLESMTFTMPVLPPDFQFEYE